MEEFITSAIVKGNEVILVLKYNKYFIYWGKEGMVKNQQELLTPPGRITSQISAYTQFLKAVESIQYLKFSKL